MGITGNGGSLCDKAREHYYALLCHDEAAVPEAVIRHVEICSFCREQIRWLGDMLQHDDDRAGPSEGEGSEGAVEALSRQFEYLGERVRCSHVKAFLPDLAGASSGIRIPTPITVHVENCPRCAQALAFIRELGLTAGQLSRLGRFYDQSALHHPSHDEHTYATAAALAVFSLDGTDPEGLEHVSRCPQCRAWVHRQRAKALAGLAGGTEGGGVLLCREISTADLFDYVLPFGLDAAAAGRADGRRDAVATHVRACRRCLDKVQSLHLAIYEIADRADSAVSTLYRCDEETREEDRRYRYPVTVQVEHRAAAPAAGGPVPAFDGAGRRRRAHSKAKASPFVRRTALAAAAAVAVALLLLTRAAIVMGTSVDDLAKALPSNVHVLSRYGRDPKPLYEMWRSRDLNKVATKGPGECIEYDLDKGLMTVIRPGLEAAAHVRPIPRERLGLARMFMNRPLGNLFGEELSDTDLSPVGRVPAPDRPGVSLSVYELAQEIPSANGLVTRTHWRILVDPQQRPVQIETSRWDAVRLAWEPDTVVELTYPTTTEMEEAFKALSAAE